jgi:hypothetical protein
MKNGYSRNSSNVGYTKHMTETKEKKTKTKEKTTHKTKMMSKKDLTTNRGDPVIKRERGAISSVDLTPVTCVCMSHKVNNKIYKNTTLVWYIEYLTTTR